MSHMVIYFLFLVIGAGFGAACLAIEAAVGLIIRALSDELEGPPDPDDGAVARDDSASEDFFFGTLLPSRLNLSR